MTGFFFDLVVVTSHELCKPMYRIFFLSLVATLIHSCSNEDKLPSPDSAYSNYIKAYSAGHLSRGEAIKIVFNDDQLKPGIHEKVSADWFSVQPAVDGELRWSSNNVLEFIPNEYLPSSSEYKATLRLSEMTLATGELSEFRFGWRTYDQGYTATFTGVEAYESKTPTLQMVRGVVNTSDIVTLDELQADFAAFQSGRELALSWQQKTTSAFSFVIDSVSRGEDSSAVMLNWTLQNGDRELSGSTSQRIAGLYEFSVINYEIVQQPDQHIKLLFSDPIAEGTDLEGLFTIGGEAPLRVEHSSNEVRIYTAYRMQGQTSVEIASQLESYAGYKLQPPFSVQLNFESLKPAVRFPGEARTILPGNNESSVAFEAVNLSAVDVRVIQVFEKNIRQFLQVNDLSGSEQLKRVGRIVRRKTIDLTGRGLDLGGWNRFYLDLSDLTSLEPGAIYRLEIGFRKHQSLYPCAEAQDDDTRTTPETDDWDSFGEEERSFWDYFDSYYYSAWDTNWNDYDWYERDNPCHSSYYRSGKFAMRNVLITDIALTAKKGGDGRLHVWANDLVSTEPLTGVSIEVEDYQGRVLGSGLTDASGYLTVNCADKQPFIVSAGLKNEKSYLKLHPNLSLSMSRFDVSGTKTEEGMKGFIYGERGVWRPGDTLFLSFMLEDAAKQLPARHPVVLEVNDARGNPVIRETRSLDEDRHLAWEVTTAKDAPTGRWNANVRIGNAVFTKSLRVENIKPNRLRIDLDFGDKIDVQDRSVSGQLHAEWLHGAPAKNLEAKVEMALRPMTTTFKGYSAYQFDDPSAELESTPVMIFDGRINSEGDATIRFDAPQPERAPGMLRATFDTRVFEQGGDFSIDHFSIPFSPYPGYVGLRTPKGDTKRGMLLTDTTHTIDLVTLTAEGRPVERQNLKYSIHKLSWRWWWNVNASESVDYDGDQSAALVFEGTASTNTEGRGSFTFRIDYPAWGRYLVRVEDPATGHATGKVVYIDWPGWAGRAQRENPEGETMLTVAADKESYLPTEVAELSFPGAQDARALITIENGSGVLHSQWVDTRAGLNKVEVQLKEEYAPNVFAFVTLIQPHATTANDSPIRLYGITRINVNDPRTKIRPSLSTPAEIEPESVYSVTVSEADGQAMSYTLAVVDEGLLGLTRYKTPDPHGYFYAPEALGVHSWDLYDEVIGAYAGEMRPLLSIGGGEAGDSGDQEVNRFKPVVQFIGPFNLKAGASAKHQLTMPNYMGSVRVMLVARKGDAYGADQVSVPVRKPLMVLATLPRTLSPGEEIDLPVNVFAMEDKLGEVTVSVKANGVQVTGLASKKLRFNKAGEEVARFRLQAPGKEGAASIEVSAQGGGESSSHRIDMMVVNPNPPVSQRYTRVLAAGESTSIDFDLPGMEGSNAVVMEVSDFTPLNLGERLEYLVQYPHGCLEQTLSRAFPQLYLADAVDIGETYEQRSRDHIHAALDRLRAFQQANGGFTYWPGSSSVNDWTSSYAGHFLIEAKEKGYTVPQDMLNQWLSYQSATARNWRAMRDRYPGDKFALAQAYRLFTLALADRAEFGAMNRLRKEKGLSATTRTILAGAYVLSGRKDAANALLEGASIQAEAYNGQSAFFGSLFRDQALMALAYTVAGDRENAGKIVKDLGEQLNRQQWLNTQETAFALMAIGKFLHNRQATPLNGEYTLNGRNKQTIQFTGAVQRPITQFKLSGNTLNFTNQSTSEVFLLLTASGQPLERTEPAEEQGIDMQVSYADLNGNPINIDRLEQGTDIVATVQLRLKTPNTQLQNVALTQAFPGGWEILNERMLTAGASAFEQSPYAYRDIRDDRIMTYFDMRYGETYTYHVRLNAAFGGTFILPATAVEAMYDNRYRARSQNKKIEVVPPGLL